MLFHLWCARCRQNPKNIHYPDQRVIASASDLKQAVCLDHVGAKFEGGIRGLKYFLLSDVSIMDCDNDHSDDPKDWVHPEDLYYLFPGVAFAVVPSRNDGKQKGNKSPRPRFHIYFLHREYHHAGQETELKRKICERFPFLDRNCKDGARFIFAISVQKDTLVIWHEGTLFIDDFMEQTRSPWIKAMEEPKLLPAPKVSQAGPAAEISMNLPAEKSSSPPQPFGAAMASQGLQAAGPVSKDDPCCSQGRPITEGSRNSTLYHMATKIVRRYGIGEDGKRKFWEQSKRCVPPLPVSELSSIWKSAEKFYQKVSEEVGYIPPDRYEKAMAGQFLWKPSDYSDMGEAKVFGKVYGEKLTYTSATDFMCYDGVRWVENQQSAYGLCQAFLDQQLEEAEQSMKILETSLEKRGVSAKDFKKGPAAMEKAAGEGGKAMCQAYQDSKAYVTFVKKRRDFYFIDATMKTVRPWLQKDISEFDRSPFLLNTPGGTYDLSKGMEGLLPHSPKDCLTKVTKMVPDTTHEALWQAMLDTLFLKDPELIAYVQQVIGLALVGKVYQEALIIAYGEGANGKSTFFNSIATVLGEYSGTLSADVLTAGCRRNVKPEMAELRGKRLIIASELEEGMRLNTSVMKQLCSVDEITGEKKYRAPFRFSPTHLLVLCTNHLPRVGARDEGTWRRLRLIPFQAKLTGTKDRKNYSDFLVREAGGAILKWAIEGAQIVIHNDFQIEKPPLIAEVFDQYREANDWMQHYLDDCCEIGKNFQQPSGTFYTAYRHYAFRQGEYARSTADFYHALSSLGFRKVKNRNGSFIQGVRLKVEYLENVG